jgi:phosphatidylserine decarboxylase
MDQEAKKAIDARYESHFGYIAGYLPKDRSAVDEWQKNLKREIHETRALEGRKKKRNPAVKELEDLISLNGIVRMYVVEMLDQQPTEYKNIETIDELLDALDKIITSAPLYNADPSKRHAFPMSELFTYMMMTKAGEAVFRNEAFNDAIRTILKEWCRFLDSPRSASVLNEGDEGWLSPSAYWLNKLYDFKIPKKSAPHWGWKSFNDYFHRDIKLEARPIAEPDNPKVIVSANDGKVYNIASNVLETDLFWLKGQPYSLVNMLNNHYVDRFIGGSVFQTFLSGADFHRWKSPIDGVVRLTQIVDGLMFSNAESAGYDPTAATYSQGYEASVNTRGLVFIESPDKNIGMVCVIPIGITEISSVTITVENGQKVRKGDELGYFSYGGSTMCLVFQPGAIDQFTVPNRPSGNSPDDGPPVRVSAQIAIAR